MTSGPKKDYAWATAAVGLVVSVPFEIIAGIWVDGRWFWTALLCLCLGLLCGTISIERDKYLARQFKEKSQ